MTTKKVYAACDHIKRNPPDFIVNEDIATSIGSNYDTLPSFEKNLYDYVLVRHYSLLSNDLLRCRWNEYKRRVKVYAPFIFPDTRDLHFHNCAIRFLPSETIHHMDHRKKLKQGPGVDGYGQIPIPQELLMKRGAIKKLA